MSSSSALSELVAHIQFKTLPPELKCLTVLGGEIMPIIDTVAHTRIRPTYLSHHKFSVPMNKAPTTEFTTYGMCLAYLQHLGTIPEGMLECNKFAVCKTGMFELGNEYDTTIRLWCSYAAGKTVVYELSIAGYKDAVSVPCGPGEFTKKVVGCDHKH